MPREATGTLEYVPANAKKRETQGHYKARITLVADGARPWVHLDPGPKSPKAEERAQERAKHWTERARREKLTAKDFGIVTKSERAAMAANHASAEPTTMQKWFDGWLAAREKKGQTSTRENDAHWRVHIQPVFGPKHIKDSTRDDLRALKLLLDQEGFGEKAVQTAWRDQKNEDVAATIIGYIRQLALGSPLLPYSERVDRAVQRLRKAHKFTDPQSKWLDRIVPQLHVEAPLEVDPEIAAFLLEQEAHSR